MDRRGQSWILNTFVGSMGVDVLHPGARNAFALLGFAATDIDKVYRRLQRGEMMLKAFVTQAAEVERKPAPDYAARPHPEASDPFVGSPDRVAEQIAQLQENGVRNLMITHYGAAVPHEKAVKSMRLLAEKVFPRFR